MPNLWSLSAGNSAINQVLRQEHKTDSQLFLFLLFGVSIFPYWHLCGHLACEGLNRYCSCHQFLDHSPSALLQVKVYEEDLYLYSLECNFVHWRVTNVCCRRVTLMLCVSEPELMDRAIG
eukprot:2003484-Amphidinium_carterae.1